MQTEENPNEGCFVALLLGQRAVGFAGLDRPSEAIRLLSPRRALVTLRPRWRGANSFTERRPDRLKMPTGQGSTKDDRACGWHRA